ncbi:hypothetical protein ACWF9X_27905 [Streptomyces globisporus]
MRRHHVGAAPLDRDAENGWEVTGLLGGTSLDGVRMAGFRDGAGAGLDMQVLPQPAVVAVLAVGEARDDGGERLRAPAPEELHRLAVARPRPYPGRGQERR